MPGYNHYSWCMCGWCYKSGTNGYSAQHIYAALDKMDADRSLARSGVNRSWAACFVIPNAKCPVCRALVYYYENEYGSKVFFDDLGWPWPKHGCTDNSKRGIGPAHRAVRQPIMERKLGAVIELLGSAKTSGFDPNANFRSKYGHSPWDLLVVVKVLRVGFQNFVQAKSISPPLHDPVFLTFTSANESPPIGDFLSFDGISISLLNSETLEPKKFKARTISQAEFDSASATPKTKEAPQPREPI